MESDLKRGIEIRKSIRLPAKRLAPAPPLPPRSSGGTDDSSKPEPPPTSLRQLLGDSPTVADSNRVPHRSVAEATSAATNSDDKRQLAVRTDGGGIGTAVPATTKLAVDDGVHELNLKNLRIADNNQAPVAQQQQQNNKMISSGQQQKVTPMLSARKMAPLSPSLVRRITSLNQGQKKVISTSTGTSTSAAAPPIKLSDLDGLVKRRDYVNQEATAGVAPLRIMPTTTTAAAFGLAKKAAIPEDVMPPLTSIDVLNQIQQQISDMEVKQQQIKDDDMNEQDGSAEDMSTYKERIKMSKRYGEKEELSMKHGTSDVASNQLLGYLGDYRDNVRPSTENDDEIDRGSEDESKHHHNQFQRGSSVRKSTGGAVMATKTGMVSATAQKGKPVTRTASDTKNLETKIKMMREAAAHHHSPTMDTKSSAARRAKPVTANKLPFSFTKPRILDMNEKHLVHQVTPPSAAVGSGTADRGSTTTSGVSGATNSYHQRPDENPSRASVQPRVQSVQSHAKKMEQVMVRVWGGCTGQVAAGHLICGVVYMWCLCLL